jgi:hypothetical protein
MYSKPRHELPKEEQNEKDEIIIKSMKHVYEEGTTMKVSNRCFGL